jgi:hypothetical protein
MYHKYTLLVGGLSYDLKSNSIKNWDNITSTISRNDYDGLTRSFTSKFEFVGEAYSLLKNEYYTNYLSSSATIIFSLRNNSWTYNEQFRCLLDFSTFENDGFTISMDGVDSSMKNIIKSNGGTEYEFNVSDLVDNVAGQLRYDGLEIEQKFTCFIVGDNNENSDLVSFVRSKTVDYPDEGGSYVTNAAQVYIGKPETMYHNKIEFMDATLESINDRFFAKSKKTTTIRFKIKFSYKCTNPSSVTIYITNANGDFTDDEYIKISENLSNEYVDVNFDQEIELKENYGVQLLFSRTQQGEPITTYYVKNQSIEISWIDSSLETNNLDIISPYMLLQAIINKMISGNNITSNTTITGYDRRIGSTFIMAAESIRGIQGAKLYTSFNKFRDWMSSTFGYTYDIDKYDITFRHRSQEFDKTVVKTIERYSDFKEAINKKLIYSRVKAGYDQQKYEEVNGRDEYHFGVVFSTGLTLNESELNLISPYRCDPYGIEILTSKIGEDTTDNNSDKDVFFVGLLYIGSGGEIGYYIPNRSDILSNVISPSTQFNAMFSPRASIEANKQLIGSCTSVLKFASSEGNSDVIINGIGLKDDINIFQSDKIFTVDTISFETDDMNLPDNFKGIIELDYRGGVKRGYINEIEINQGKRKVTKYELIKSV